VKIYNEPR